MLVLERANRFDTFVSLIRAYRIWAPLIWPDAQWTGTPDFGDEDLFSFDPIFFASFVQSINSIYEALGLILKQSHTRYIHLYYDDFTNGDKEIARACEFIGVDYISRITEVKKEITRNPFYLFRDSHLVERHIRVNYPQYWRPKSPCLT